MADDSPVAAPPCLTELIVFGGASRPDLIATVERTRAKLPNWEMLPLCDIAFTLNCPLMPAAWRLSVVASSVADLCTKLDLALVSLRDERCAFMRDVSGIYFFEKPLADEGELAFMFPGEGSQYPHMLHELYAVFPEVRVSFDLLDRAYDSSAHAFLPSDLVFRTANQTLPAPDTLNKVE